MRIPAPVEQIKAARVGGDVYVTFTIPDHDLDDEMPADLGRVELFGYTGRTAPTRTRFVELGHWIATIPVAPPPPAPDKKVVPPPPDHPADAPLQGAEVTVRDTLTPDELEQGRLPPLDPRRPPTPDPRPPNTEPRTPNTNQEPGTGQPELLLPLKRFYLAIPFNVRGRPSAPGTVVELPLHPVPEAPPAVEAVYTDTAVTITWEPSGGLLGYLLEQTLPDEPSPLIDEEPETPPVAPTEPSGPVGYNVYVELGDDPFAPAPAAPGARWSEEPPAPLNPAPLSAFLFSDSVEFGRERCYTVRAVRGTGADQRIGDASPLACITPIDTFAPRPPRQLAAVASEGAISLIWAPSADLDLGGYVVLRGDAPGATLLPLTTAPLIGASYKDTTVKPGVRYVYAVVAVDSRIPVPNVSAESNRVEETAR